MEPEQITTETRIPLTILPATTQAMAEVIDHLGHIATTDIGKRNDVPVEIQQAIDSLNAMEDTRVIPWAVRMFQIRNVNQKCEAINILSKFNSPTAFQILKAGLAVRGSDILNYSTATEANHGCQLLRVATVYALVHSPYPKALELIKTLLHDPDEEIRWTIVDTLTYEKPIEIVCPILRKMVHDPSPKIRDLVKDYFKTHRKGVRIMSAYGTLLP